MSQDAGHLARDCSSGKEEHEQVGVADCVPSHLCPDGVTEK